MRIFKFSEPLKIIWFLLSLIHLYYNLQLFYFKVLVLTKFRIGIAILIDLALLHKDRVPRTPLWVRSIEQSRVS